jgi:hypothetical protein
MVLGHNGHFITKVTILVQKEQIGHFGTYQEDLKVEKVLEIQHNNIFALPIYMTGN